MWVSEDLPMTTSTCTRAWSYAPLLLVSLIGGCGLLDTNQPNIINPGTINSPEGAQSLRLGAIADFGFVKDGDGTQFQDGLILITGLLSDEFVHSTTPPSEQEIDQRTTALINPSLSDVYRNLHKARAGAENAATALRQFLLQPDSTPDIAEMQTLAGFTYIYFAEDFCSGVPFSRVSGDSLIFGLPQTSTQTLGLALSKFDSALAQPGMALDDGSIANLAAVGRGRALLDLDSFPQAAAAVAAVPTDFVYATEHAETPLRLQNAIWSYTNGFLWSVSDSEGVVGLPYRTAADPRVPYTDFEDVGLDLITPQFSLDKYPDASAPVPVADGIEARLIEAEAQLQAGSRSGMTSTLQDLRDFFPDFGLGNLSTPGTIPEATDLLFSERAFWLFATGHRLGDMRRLIRVYQRSPDTVFPTGAYHKGGTYGTDVNLPIPIEEQNNPNSSGCLDRNP
jgi:starch-binding outer membrane protein, SusD/RagB family